MQTKIIPSQPVIYYSKTTTLRELPLVLSERIDQKLQKEIEKQKIKISGPIQWNYYGTDGQLDTTFTLEIAYPVDKIGHEGEFCFRNLPEFKCAYLSFKGFWKDLKDGYSVIIPEMVQTGLELTGNCREIYLEIFFPDSSQNITEIQVEYK